MPNKLTRDVQEFVDEIFSRVDPFDKLESLLAAESEQVQHGVLKTLLEYRFGKPKENISMDVSLTYSEAWEKVKERLRASSQGNS